MLVRTKLKRPPPRTKTNALLIVLSFAAGTICFQRHVFSLFTALFADPCQQIPTYRKAISLSPILCIPFFRGFSYIRLRTFHFYLVFFLSPREIQPSTNQKKRPLRAPFTPLTRLQSVTKTLWLLLYAYTPPLNHFSPYIAPNRRSG